MDWKYCASPVEAILEIKDHRPTTRIIAVEQDKRSIPIKEFKPEFPLALIVGNESYGISEEVLSQCDRIVELPMHGINKSLNVMVTLGIVLYRVMEYI